jgi:toxin FitB
LIWLNWRLLVEDGRKTRPLAARSAKLWAGHTYSQPDLIIAATALHHGLTVVSRDTSDFTKARVPVFNPWRDTNAA